MPYGKLGLLLTLVGAVCCGTGCGLSRGGLLTGHPPSQSEPSLEFAAQTQSNSPEVADTESTETSLAGQTEPGAAPTKTASRGGGSFLKSAGSGLRKVIPLPRTDLSKSARSKSAFDSLPEPGDQSEDFEEDTAGGDGPIQWNDSE